MFLVSDMVGLCLCWYCVLHRLLSRVSSTAEEKLALQRAIGGKAGVNGSDRLNTHINNKPDPAESCRGV